MTRPRPRASLRRAARRLARSERGAAVVEFAIVVPILLVLVMAIIDFGRLYSVALSLTAATRDGARMAATLPDLADATGLANVRARVVAGFQPMGGAAITAGQVVVAPDAGAQVVTVSVSGYTYVPVTPIARLVGMGTVTLTRAATFRWERAS